MLTGPTSQEVALGCWDPHGRCLEAAAAPGSLSCPLWSVLPCLLPIPEDGELPITRGVPRDWETLGRGLRHQTLD